MIWGPLVLVGLHDPSQSDQKTSHGGGRRAENWRSFSSKVLAFSVPNATRLAAVPGTPHNHKYEKSSWKALSIMLAKAQASANDFMDCPKLRFEAKGTGRSSQRCAVAWKKMA